ncbi:MAG: DUF5329 family protein [Chthoniobacterales bacterium]
MRRYFFCYPAALKTSFLVALVWLSFLPGLVSAREAREQARIDFLLNAVEHAANIKFIRNGTEYDGRAAATHLRHKLDYGGERLKTAEDFVKYCATESSMTHRKYKVSTGNGVTTEAAAFFTAKLLEFDHAGH